MVPLSVYFFTVAVTLAFSTAAAPMPRGQGRHLVRHAYLDVPPVVSPVSGTSLANKTQAASNYSAVPPATSTHVPPAAYSDVNSANGTVVYPHRSTPVPSANETSLASGTKYSVPPAASSAVSLANSIMAYWTAHPKYSHPSHVPSPVSPAVPSTSLTTASPLSTYSSSASSVEPSWTAPAVAYTAPASGSIVSTGFQTGYDNLGVNNALPNLDLSNF
ncbi:hypothetical protein JB92DRAFT_2890728 [Gautieria morchelliformis]|nr:hypothetical protein JB92DRAFT_2890728 [Gautieria morchelliformis]